MGFLHPLQSIDVSLSTIGLISLHLPFARYACDETSNGVRGLNEEETSISQKNLSSHEQRAKTAEGRRVPEKTGSEEGGEGRRQ